MTSIEMCEAIRMKLADYEMQQKDNDYLNENGRWLAAKVIEQCRTIVIEMQMEEEKSK
jgi:hypothetical protein